MMVSKNVEVNAITANDVVSVGQFLNRHLNRRLSAATWAKAIIPTWSAHSPNHGFMLTSNWEIVGAYLAFYSERLINGRTERFCNLAAFCVVEEYRSQGLRLARALLAQRGFHFTDLSPSGNVVELNKRLGFTSLDAATVLVPNLPWPPVPSIKVTCDLNVIERTLRGNDRLIFQDHRGASAVCHILVSRGSEHCYVIIRKDRRKNLPLFASILYVGNSELLRQTRSHLSRHLLLHHQVPVTLAEIRVVGFRPKGPQLRRPRPKMFKSRTLGSDAIDYLYSELTCVAW